MFPNGNIVDFGLIIINIGNSSLVIVGNIVNVYLYSVNTATVLAEILPRNM